MSTPSRFVRMVQPRFVPLVLSGAKHQTMRLNSVRLPCVGDILDLRQWSDKPYHSKHIKLIEAPLLHREAVMIEADGLVTLGCPHRRLARREAEAFARADGFTDHDDMIAWLKANHKPIRAGQFTLLFSGWVFYWDPSAYKTRKSRLSHARAR